MMKANGLDRALLHGLHLRLAKKPETISPAALRAVLRVAEAYSQGIRDAEPSADVVAEFDEDSLALVEVLTLALLQEKTLGGTLDLNIEGNGDARHRDVG